MTQEEKDLLLRDISGRLPYGVIIEHEGNLSVLDTIFMCDNISVSSTSLDNKTFYNLNLDEFKPYLFPMSSMTEEQKREYNSLRSIGTDECGDITYFNTFESIDWCNKNHFDYRGLIEKGLAIDATELNIY